MQVDFLPITHQAALGELGRGATGDVRQTFINPEYSLAFKRIHNLPTTINEMIVYAYQPLRLHPYVVQLEGISWDVSDTGDVAPNLVFEKSPYGDCETFMRSAEGQRLKIEDKVSYCLQIAKALDETHRAHIIHGDIKPQNILMFSDSAHRKIAKLSDFGFSSYIPFPEEQSIYMPKSVPWSAPEHHHRGFSFAQAVKMDIYSFGLFSFWLLLENANGPKAFIFQGNSTHADPSTITKLAKRLLSAQFPLGSSLRAKLSQLFDLSLACNPDQRARSMIELIRALEPPEFNVGRKFIQFLLGLSNRYCSNQIASAVDQLFEVDIRVRQVICTCLQSLMHEAQRNVDPAFCKEIGYQLAFCYRMGFGVRKDENECRKWLYESKNHESDLEHQLQLIRSTLGRRHIASSKYDLWFKKGHIPMPCDVQYYREKNRLNDILSAQENEINDWKTTLGCTHWLILEREEQYFEILRSLGYWDKAEDLVKGTHQNIGTKLPPDDLRVLRAQSNVAIACFDQRKTDDAERLIKEVLRESDKLSVSNQTACSRDKEFLASVYTAQGRVAKAIRLRGEVYKQCLSMLGENHIQTLRVLWNLREDYFRRGHLQRAARLNYNLLEITTKALGEGHELTILAKIGLAQIRWSSRRWFWGHVGPRKKTELTLDLIRDSRRVLGDEHPITLQLMSHTARYLVFKTRFSDAIALCEQIIELSIRRAGADHADTVDRKKWLEAVKATYRWYMRFEKLGTVHLGDYVITPSVGTRFGLERVWGPLFKKTDPRPMVPFFVNSTMADSKPD